MENIKEGKSAFSAVKVKSLTALMALLSLGPTPHMHSMPSLGKNLRDSKTEIKFQ